MRLFCLVLLLFSQSSFSHDYFPREYDSVLVKIGNQVSKEMVIDPQQITDDILLEKRLSFKQEQKLRKQLKKASIRSHDYALLSHHNIELNWYLGPEIVYQIYFSTRTLKTTCFNQFDIHSWGLTATGVKFLKKFLKEFGAAELITEEDYFPEY